MTRSILITLTVFLGICAFVTTNSAFKNSQEDVILFYNIFKDWITQSNKQYGIEEMAVRFMNWKSNFDFVQEQNSKRGLTYKLEMNGFAAMAPEEFSALYLGLNNDLELVEKHSKTAIPHKHNHSKLANHSSYLGLPRSVDWRKSGAVTPVKNQGKCGGCWAFAASGALEGLYAIKYKKLADFSEQQMIDCSAYLGNKGCDGGLMTAGFAYTQVYGIEPDKGYEYTASVNECRQDTDRVVFRNTGYKEVPANNSLALKKAVARQPVSVGIEASSLTVQLFKNGVITTGCSTNLDHGVLVVGYDVAADGQEYWIVKNSWGPKWGLKGYFHVAMGNQNTGMGVCGINRMASYPTL
jgi:KDEL-tailed cysteine endopeptidase